MSSLTSGRLEGWFLAVSTESVHWFVGRFVLEISSTFSNVVTVLLLLASLIWFEHALGALRLACLTSMFSEVAFSVLAFSVTLLDALQ